MEPLGALSGAAGGMADAVAGIIEQRLRQTQVANQLAESQARNAQAQAALAETQRAHIADEATRQQSANELAGYRTAVEQDTKSRNADIARKDLLGTLHTAPIGTPITADEQTRAIAAGQPAGSFTQYQPPSMGMSTPQGEVGPSAAQPAGLWRGTQQQIEQAAKDAMDRRNVPLGPVEKDAAGNYFRVGPDGVKKPITDETGNPVKAYQPPVQPFLLQTDNGYMLAPKTGGAATPISGPGGQPVSPKSSAQILNRQDMAGSVLSHFDHTQELLKEAEDKGLLGPIGGRVSDFMAGKVGSTGSEENDALLSELRMNLGLVSSGVASLHGRAGANAGIADKIQKNIDEGHMSYAQVSQGLKALRDWTTAYATPKKGGSAPGPTGDPLIDRLNQRRQQQQ